ncbi:MAG: hypothetical protein N2Z73_00425 [Endomicrobia bacterium]|nr:hypothetical protein [Endomicrobiia bacterium]
MLNLSDEELFNIVRSTVNITPAKPLMIKDIKFTQLDVLSTYYFLGKLYDWSGNMSTSTIVYNVPIIPDDTIPLYAVGVKAENKPGKFLLRWERVRHHYNITKRKIERFNGINNHGETHPSTFELYKYKIYYKQNLLDDGQPWREVASLPPEITSCELPLVNGYYKVISYDITGNKDESLVVDTNFNYYIYKNGMYIKLPRVNGENIATKLFYYNVVEYPQENSGRIVKVLHPVVADLDEKEGRFVNFSSYEFDEENTIGIRYKVENNKVKFVVANSILSIDIDKLTTQLAFYVYDGKEYVRATTFVDKENRILYFKSKYFSKIQLRRVDTTAEFNFVEVKPKVITPDSSPGENDFVFFVFNNPKLSEVKIKIYDINSILVQEIITNRDSSTPGSYLSWDGRDFSGKYVQPGVYIYQIEAEGKKYKGLFTIAR